MPEPTPCNHCHDEFDPCLEVTMVAVDWNLVSCFHRVYRFLTLAGVVNSRKVTFCAFPLHGRRKPHRARRPHPVPARRGGLDCREFKTFVARLSSLVATMQYVRAHTRTPVSRVIHHSVVVDSGSVGSPYIIMTKVDEVALSAIRDHMEDSKREVVLRQVVDILLELAFRLFGKIRMLFQQESRTNPKNAWYIGLTIPRPDDSTLQESLSKTFVSVQVIDYWLAYSNNKLKTIYDTQFGGANKVSH